MNTIPSGTSMKNLIHVEDLYLSKTMRKFDYGKEENMERYG